MTNSMKHKINNMTYEEMLYLWRFSPSGYEFFQGEIGEYFSKVMAEKKKLVDHAQISKIIGWKE